MKKVTNYLLLFFMSATVLFLTSCGEDGDIVPTVDPATVSFQTGGEDFTDTTAAPGSSITFDLAIDFGGEEVTGVNVTDDLGATVFTSTFTQEPATPIQVTYDVPDNATGDIIVTADLVDANGASVADAAITVTAEATVPATIYEAFLLAAPTGDNNSNSFYSTATGNLYSFDDVVSTTANLSETIDFGYAYGQSEGANINAPSAYPSYIGYDMTRWGTLNETLFRTPSTSVEEFDAITEDQGNLIADAFEVGATGETDRVLNLAANSVVAFRTADDRYGLIKVVEIVGTTGSADGIRIEVKVTGTEDNG